MIAAMADSYASEFARKGGKARAQKMTAEERRESARKAIAARWAKQRELTKQIKEGTKALLAKAKKREASVSKKKQKG